MTFRVRTALVVLMLTAVTMGGAFTAVWDRFVAAQRTHLDHVVHDVARLEAEDARYRQLLFSEAPGPYINSVGPLPKYGVIYDVSGAALSTTRNLTLETAPPMPEDQPLDTPFDVDHGGKTLRGVLVAVPGSTHEMLLALPRDDFEEDARTLGDAMLFAFVVGCVWAALVAFGVATRLTRQHRVVGEAARAVAGGDTSARVELRTADVDLRQLADDINAMIQQLVGLLATQERFVAHAAHELRTPLTSLRIEIEHALRTGKDRQDFEEALGGALDSAQRLTNLAEDLLQLARVKATKAEEQTALVDAVADAVADAAPVGRARGVTVTVDVKPVTVHGSRTEVARIFRNLLENAVRFSPDGAVVRVLSAEKERGRIHVRVVDEGPGVAHEDREKIFEPFARGPWGRDREGRHVREVRDAAEGTGLGLAIARGLARALGGELRVEPGDHGCFVAVLPIHAP